MLIDSAPKDCRDWTSPCQGPPSAHERVSSQLAAAGFCGDGEGQNLGKTAFPRRSAKFQVLISQEPNTVKAPRRCPP